MTEIVVRQALTLEGIVYGPALAISVDDPVDPVTVVCCTGPMSTVCR